MVSVNDLGQGSEAIRILGIRWLPSGAAARSVTEDGNLQGSGKDSQQGNDRKVSGQGEVDTQAQNNTQQGNDGAQEQVASGLEAEQASGIGIESSEIYADHVPLML